VDLVDEQHVPGFEAREDRGEVAGPLDRRAGGGPQLRADLGIATIAARVVLPRPGDPESRTWSAA
jgi:hypothetical protein